MLVSLGIISWLDLLATNKVAFRLTARPNEFWATQAYTPASCSFRTYENKKYNQVTILISGLLTFLDAMAIILSFTNSSLTFHFLWHQKV